MRSDTCAGFNNDRVVGNIGWNAGCSGEGAGVIYNYNAWLKPGMAPCGTNSLSVSGVNADGTGLPWVENQVTNVMWPPTDADLAFDGFDAHLIGPTQSFENWIPKDCAANGMNDCDIPTDADGNTRTYPTTAGAFLAGGTTPATPTITLSPSKSYIYNGNSLSLTWSSTNATSCTASGAWSGTKATSGSQSISPTTTSTYTLSCTGAGGSSSQSVTPTVYKAGDATHNGSVDVFDLSTLLSNYATTNAACDFSGNGSVDVFDLSILLSNYGG